MKDMNICKKKLFSREPQSGYGVGSIELAKCAIFNTNCTISCDTRTHFLWGRRAKDKQTKRR